MRYILLLIAIVATMRVCGKEKLSRIELAESVTEIDDEDTLFIEYEQMPQFLGGEVALMKFIADNLHYPDSAKAKKIQGRVVVKFVVTKTGEIGEVKIVRSKDLGLDKEAVRIVKSLPNFIPGKLNGEVVDMWYTLPITFKLQE
ncbi:MAG: energy transducer TonB [Muribaculaceae bacterium]|nr:energy transducer TonB [Muribaculaceae bacterium]